MNREIKQQLKVYSFFKNVEDREEINPATARGEGGEISDVTSKQ